MEYHPEWETNAPEQIIAEHSHKMEKLLRDANLEISYLASTVKTYLNVNEMVWGWKQPETDRDHIDLLTTVIDRYPQYYRTADQTGWQHMGELIAILRDGLPKRAETMEDHYQPEHRNKPAKTSKRKVDTHNDWTNGNGVDDGDDDVVTAHHHTVDTPVYHTPSHTCDNHSHGYSDSGGGGGGGGGCD